MYHNIKDLEVYYEIMGKGKPILMIHEYFPDHHLMKGCMEPIFTYRGGYQRIYFDLPGMGKTKAAEWITNGEHYLEVVLGMIEEFIGDQPFLVVGESFGGFLARWIIEKKFAQVDGMFLICPSVKGTNLSPKHEALKQDNKLLDSLSKEDRAWFEPVSIIHDTRNWKRYDTDVMPGLRSANIDFLLKNQNEIYSLGEPESKFPKPYSKPSLILSGRQDSMTGYKNIWNILDYYTRCSFNILDAAGHCLQHEREEAFNTLTHDWLDRVDGKL